LHKIIRRALIFGAVGPALLAPLTVFGWHGRGYPWWHYLVVIIGGGYLIPVFGTLAGWKLLAILQKVSPGIIFVLRALVGVIVFSASIIVATTRSPAEIGNTAKWLFLSPSGLILLLVIGFSYAGLPALVHWLQQRK